MYVTTGGWPGFLHRPLLISFSTGCPPDAPHLPESAIWFSLFSFFHDLSIDMWSLAIKVTINDDTSIFEKIFPLFLDAKGSNKENERRS
jgi:hypothetical protein